MGTIPPPVTGERAAIFIDAGYWAALLREYFGEPRVSYEALPGALGQGIPILRTYWYDCLPFLPSHPSAQDIARHQAKEKFLNRLQDLEGWTISKGHLRRRYISFKAQRDPGGGQRYSTDGLPMYEKCRTTRDAADGCLLTFTQKGVDIAFAGDLITLAATRQITDAILVTGDNDFLQPVERAKSLHGVRVTLWYHQTSHNEELRKAADRRRTIDQAFIDSLRIATTRAAG